MIDTVRLEGGLSAIRRICSNASTSSDASDLSRSSSTTSSGRFTVVDAVTSVDIDEEELNEIPDLADCSLISVHELGVSGFITVCDNAVRRKLNVAVTETAWAIEQNPHNIHELIGVTPENLRFLATELLGDEFAQLSRELVNGSLKMVECGSVTIQINRHSISSKYVLRAASMGTDVRVYCHYT